LPFCIFSNKIILTDVLFHDATAEAILEEPFFDNIMLFSPDSIQKTPDSGQNYRFHALANAAKLRLKDFSASGGKQQPGSCLFCR
jgi:hypothetical protein